MSRVAPDITGQRFGKLVAKARVRTADGCVNWRCECDCGNVRVVRIASLLKGSTQSCGCLRRTSSQERFRRLRLSQAGQQRYRKTLEEFFAPPQPEVDRREKTWSGAEDAVSALEMAWR